MVVKLEKEKQIVFSLLIFCFLPPTHTPTIQLFEYRRLVHLLLRLIEDREDGDDFVRRIAIYLLNSLACQVDGEQKMLVGDLGAIEVSNCFPSHQTVHLLW